MRLPARLSKNRDDPNADPDHPARYEFKRLLEENRFQTFRYFPDRWAESLSKKVLKHLVLLLLERLDDPEKLNDIDDPLSFFVMSRTATGEPGDVYLPLRKQHIPMLEQDVYVTNGRCAFALEKLLHITLPNFNAKLVEDKKKLKKSIREAHYRVIEAMDFPE